MDAARGASEYGSGAQINHGHALHWHFGLGPRARCQRRRLARGRGGVGSAPGKAAAVQSETHLPGREGRGAAAGRGGASPRTGASGTGA